ncbi:exodeoxyribonuclease III [Rickettsia endosymbiont of Cardiosporidium cionae]|uniref:exodeoxyribonuclease III n=1 Tax=Rickettsia endosymbiont of Cardiosporidium cionae TaxID=2777155 RepID=UPI0018936B97|nr:exodeoxyribonuclease III [Rickettsia endosymbiont of Cardiosporidium cionae]KAF8818491.1 exodeoxyribonuclease III [Rickettsia endosymbiont of Cardiosporidium cionae]
MLKIATWNINSIHARIKLLHKFIKLRSPDVICLQETKVVDPLFPLAEIQAMGYKYVVFKGEKSYNGVAIASKYPLTNVFSLTFYNQDARHISATIEDIEIFNFYVPAGGDIPDAAINTKFDHKLSFITLMMDWFIRNRFSNNKIILLGDLNIAPYAQDVWSSKALKFVVSHTDVERDMLIRLQNLCGFLDTARHFVDYNNKLYSWWSYRNRDWKKSDRGRRLDHIWVSHSLKNSIQNMEILCEARDWERPSDHVPCILDLNIFS